MMASSTATDVDEVEFVSEGLQRPVLEYIDLLSEGEDEAPGTGTVEDQVDRQKAKVASTLDRLARQVALEKQERAEKCRAFNAKMVSQQEHGRQGLAYSRNNGENHDAKHCVNMWLKMPGLRPGVVHTGFRRGRRSTPCPTNPSNSSRHACPVINCGRVFDSVLLLEGHVKRFDHSPCDPTILLNGIPIDSMVCVACCRHFHSKDSWEHHLRTMASSHSPEGHVSTQTCQVIQCFACPCCCLLFNLRDQCLQHMAAQNHFTQFFTPSERNSSASMPIPVPRYAKNRLVALCKDVPFCIRCTSCRKVLQSHMEAQAHFNVYCRQGGAVAEADQTVAQVMRQLCVYGRCVPCRQLFFGEGEAEGHVQETQHEVHTSATLEQSLLHYSDHHDALRGQQAALSAASKRPGSRRDRAVGSSAKRRKQQSHTVTWACECGLCFPEEAAVQRHLLVANQIFHKCAVCSKEMGEASIARLHMSRFHGGAHLSNFLFWCRRCQVDMPRQENILLHIGEAHSGHTYYREQEATEDKIASVSEPAPSAKPSAPSSAAPSETVAGPSAACSRREERWLCRMCEDLFETEADVRAHCSDVGAHSFQRFVCGGCGQKFFKEPTLRRHCASEHGGRVLLRHFCGLCDSMEIDSEEDFLRHYHSLHSGDYYRMEDKARVDAPTFTEMPGPSAKPQCPCMATEKSNAARKAAFTRCMKRLSISGRCTYTCLPCGLHTPYYVQVKKHLQLEHGSAMASFRVICGSCPETCVDVPSFHTHHHAQHCSLEPCLSQRGACGAAHQPIAVPRVLNAEEVNTEANAEEFEEVKHAIARSSEESRRHAVGDSGGEDLTWALALSAEDAREQADFDKEMEDAIKRSLLEF